MQKTFIFLQIDSACRWLIVFARVVSNHILILYLIGSLKSINGIRVNQEENS